MTTYLRSQSDQTELKTQLIGKNNSSLHPSLYFPSTPSLCSLSPPLCPQTQISFVTKIFYSFLRVKPGGRVEREAIIRILVEKGANVNENDYHNYSPLHYAVILGWINTVKLLLDNNADVNATTAAGKNALMFAVEFDRDEIMEYLLTRHDLYIDAADTDGYTALIMAVEKSGDDGMLITNMLLRAKADPNLVTGRRKTCLKIACLKQDLPMIHLLMNSSAQRRPSAFSLLQGEAFDQIMKRIEQEDKRAKDLADKAERERMKKALEGHEEATGGGVRNRNPWGQWVDYNDKRGRGIFYYNIISRVSQWEKPLDFVKNKERLVKDVTFGLHFYH